MFECDSRDPLDDAIDRAARALTAVRPPASLPAAVRARLGGEGHAVSVWRPRAIGVAVALAAVFVAWSVAIRDTTRPVVESRARSGAWMWAMPGEVGGTRRLPEAGGDADRRMIVRGTPQLSPLAPIVVESLDVAPLADAGPMEIEALDVPMPLLADRLDIEPLVIQ